MTTTPTSSPAPEPGRRRGRRARPLILGVLGAAILLGVAAAGYAAVTARQEAQTLADRQDGVAARGRTVMPFDLEQTTHVFTERPDGGIQTVVADDPTDAAQVRLTREHLQEEAAAFTRGDYTDPASIHGADMPGLAALQAGATRIRIDYQDVPDGGRITFTTSDPALVDAIHAWFRAQTSDHGSHAEHQGG